MIRKNYYQTSIVPNYNSVFGFRLQRSVVIVICNSIGQEVVNDMKIEN